MDPAQIAVTCFIGILTVAGALGAAWFNSSIATLRKDVGHDLERHRQANSLVISRLEQRIESQEREIALLKARESSAAVFIERLDSDYARSLSVVRAKLEALGTELVELLEMKRWAPNALGHGAAEAWLTNIWKNAATITQNYSRHMEHDRRLYQEVRAVELAVGAIGFEHSGGFLVARSSAERPIDEALQKAMVLADELQRSFAEGIRTPPSAAASGGSSATSE